MSEPVHKNVRQMAVVTCLIALLPICIGSLVTTLKAGMAFPDWPTSDGQNMFLYNFFQDLRNPEKLSEHTHRLAGILIGFVSIGLLVTCCVREGWNWVTKTAIVILLAVIGQGLLGGLRVIQNQQTLAMVHSITGALFFVLCCVFAYATLRSGSDRSSEQDEKTGPIGAGLLVLYPLAVLIQYILGSNFRHRYLFLNQHILGAVLVSGLTLAVLLVLFRSQSTRLRRQGWLVSGCILLQVGLGVGAYLTKLGFPKMGIQAVLGSWQQNFICSAHTVGGMLLLMVASLVAFEAGCLFRAGQFVQLKASAVVLTQDGGVA